MSDTQTVWMILWKRATQGSHPREPFEIAEVVPEVTRSLNISEREATRLVSGLLQELDRLPAGQRYFAREGNAVVPLPEFANVHQDPNSELRAYPYEL
jgi:hypothetical protein